MWTKTLGGGNDEVSYSVQQTSDGGYIVCGYAPSTGAGSRDAWLIKLLPVTCHSEDEDYITTRSELGPPIVRGPLLLPGNSNCQLFDITGRKIDVSCMIPGVYYILEDRNVVQKIIRTR